MKYISQVAVFIFTIWLCEKVKCNPHRRFKSLQKNFYFELQPIPFKHFSVLLKRITPFGEYEVDHSIKKRQVVQNDDVAPIPSDVSSIEGGTLENILKIQKNGAVGNAEHIPLEPNLTPQVIITSIIKPIEDDVPLSIPLPIPGEMPIDQKKIEDVDPPEEIVHRESKQKITEILSSSDNVIEINPEQKIEVVQPESPDIKNIVLSTPVESTVPLVSKIPLIQNPYGPFLFTDISRIPLSGIYPAPSISVPEFIVPSPQLLSKPPLAKPVPVPPPEIKPPPPVIPPMVKEDIPIIREESPNLLVKGSRFVLYFGSMMLQMLSQLVNGRINLSQPIDIPLPTTP